MDIRLKLAADAEAKLRDRAAAAGKDPETFALDAVLEKLHGPRTLAEILAPIHKEVEESGVPDDELETLFQTAIAESRRARKGT